MDVDGSGDTSIPMDAEQTLGNNLPTEIHADPQVNIHTETHVVPQVNVDTSKCGLAQNERKIADNTLEDLTDNFRQVSKDVDLSPKQIDKISCNNKTHKTGKGEKENETPVRPL